MALKKSNLAIDSSIPSSSMGDIAFLLIVFFMVTAVFAARKGLLFTLPKQDEEQIEAIDDGTRAVYIRLIPPDKLAVDGSLMTVNQMKTYIMDKLAINPKKYVIIHADDETKFSSVINVMDDLRQLKVVNISLPSKAEIASWPYIPELSGPIQ